MHNLNRNSIFSNIKKKKKNQANSLRILYLGLCLHIKILTSLLITYGFCIN